MEINEIFYSLQGEGIWSGKPNIFIRTTGCNLRCQYCDTKYSYKQGFKKSVPEIIQEIKKFPCKFVCITGGEPLIQPDIYSLMNIIIDNNYKIILETNGSLDISNLRRYKNTIISLDIKCPSSKMHNKMKMGNINFLRKKDQLKFVIFDRNDYDYARDVIKKHSPNCLIFFQPVWGTNSKNLAKWILKDGLDIQMGLQLHKIIWGNERKR
jgi:7-carboxy-7-deazaguanine synthase